MSKNEINFARLEEAIKKARTNFPATDRTKARSFFGWVFRERVSGKTEMFLAERALAEYSIPPQEAAGYRHVVASYFNIPVNRYGKPVLKKRAG